MAVIALISGIEEQFDIVLNDDEISGQIFETVGSLSDFVALKLAH
jgi:acyl carrier protein